GGRRTAPGPRRVGEPARRGRGVRRSLAIPRPGARVPRRLRRREHPRTRPRRGLHGRPLMADPRVARAGATLTLTSDETAGVEILYLEAIRRALFEEMEGDERVFVLGQDVGVYGGAFKVTEGLQERFGKERVLDTP